MTTAAHQRFCPFLSRFIPSPLTPGVLSSESAVIGCQGIDCMLWAPKADQPNPNIGMCSIPLLAAIADSGYGLMEQRNAQNVKLHATAERLVTLVTGILPSPNNVKV